MTKPEIRKKYIGLREALPETEVDKLSQKICDQFYSSIDLSKIRVLHSFLPIVSKKEVNTWLIIDQLRTLHSRIKVSIPKVDGTRLVNFYFENKNQLSETQWKILEPTSGEITPTEKIDLVLVPLLAFDKKGNRVGYGKGFYDKFLAECRNDCLKVGLSFFDRMSDLIPADTYDVSLDLAITPTTVYRIDH